MSQFATIQTTIKDGKLLVQCLKEMGYSVEEGHNLKLHGYLGDTRPQTADIVIRRKHLGSASNDIGFRKVGDAYQLIISDYDRGAGDGRAIQTDLVDKVVRMEREIREEMIRIEREIQNAVMRKYADQKVRKTIEELKKQGFTLRRRTEKGKQVVYECVRLT